MLNKNDRKKIGEYVLIYSLFDINYLKIVL